MTLYELYAIIAMDKPQQSTPNQAMHEYKYFESTSPVGAEFVLSEEVNLWLMANPKIEIISHSHALCSDRTTRNNIKTVVSIIFRRLS